MINGFTVQNWKKKMSRIPLEDSLNIDEETNSIAVADGVTRDPMPYLPDTGTLSGKYKFAKSYPNPSPAKKAADDFTAISINVLKQSKIRDKKAIMQAFQEANNVIKTRGELRTKNTDYLVNDFPGCVASLTSCYDGAVHWGFICDCGLCIVDKKGEIKFKTRDEGPSVHDKYIWEIVRANLGKDANWRMPEARRIVRSHFRNNPFVPHSFGVLTGEENATEYVRTGSSEIKPEDTLLVYSDGVSEIIFNKNGLEGKFASKIAAGDWKCIKRMCQRRVHSEGTLAAYQINSQ